MTAPTRRGGPVVVAGPRRAARAQEARRQRGVARRRRAVQALGVLVPSALVGWVLLLSPVLALRAVVVEGTVRLTPAQVVGAAAARTGTPLLRLDTGAVADRVRALAPVARVTVRRSWPHVLRVTVVERHAVAGVRDATALRLLDPAGVAFATAGALPPGAVLLDTPHPGPADAATRAGLRVLVALPPALRAQLARLAAPAPDQVLLVLRDGRQVLWGDAGDGARKAAATTALLRLPGRSYDVSLPDVVTRR